MGIPISLCRCANQGYDAGSRKTGREQGEPIEGTFNQDEAAGKAIEIMTKEFGADAVKLAHPYVNMGNGYKRTQKLEDAERCYREALRLIEINDAKTPEQLSLVLLNLGAVCSESGRYEEAEHRYREVLDLRIAAYGRNHWRVGNTYNNLANCVRQMRNFDAAEEYIQKAIEILEARPESLSNAIDTLSRLREDQGRVDEALEAATRARETQQNLPTPDLTELATLFEREALLAGRMGDQDRANDCRSRAAGRANPPGGGCSASARSRSHEHARSASDARTASTGVTPACAGAGASIVSLRRRRMPTVSTDVSSEQDEYGKPGLLRDHRLHRRRHDAGGGRTLSTIA